MYLLVKSWVIERWNIEISYLQEVAEGQRLLRTELSHSPKTSCKPLHCPGIKGDKAISDPQSVISTLYRVRRQESCEGQINSHMATLQ